MTRAFATLLALFVTVPLSDAQAPQIQRPSTDPLPIGQRIVAHEGDVVVVEEDARVKIVRRREANVRVIYNAAQHWVVVLADYVVPDGGDGRVDATYTFNNIAGAWPLEARWEGAATLEDYTAPGEFGPQSFGLVTPRGLVQIVSQPSWLKDQNAVAVLTNRGTGRNTGPGASFDDAERRAMESVSRSAERNTLPAPASVSMTLEGTSNAPAAGGNYPAPQAPVRVGGSVRQPTKIVDAKPVYPETARSAGLHGVVILEITIGADGSVVDAKVLRSIPLLDEPALEAVKQWRFTPTLLNGAPVPVIMTTTVQF